MRLATLLASTVLFAACGGGSSDPASLTSEGYSALASGDHAAAAKAFDDAVAAIGTDTANASYVRANLGAIQARCKSDATRAKEDFMALAAAVPDKLKAKDYSAVASRLGEANHMTEAIALLEAGKQAFPTDEELDRLGGQLVEYAKKAGDSAATEALQGLGYVGD